MGCILDHQTTKCHNGPHLIAHRKCKRICTKPPKDLQKGHLPKKKKKKRKKTLMKHNVLRIAIYMTSGFLSMK